MADVLTPSDKEFISIHMKHLPKDVYCTLVDAATDEQKRLAGRKRCGLRDGFIKIVRAYQESLVNHNSTDGLQGA